VKIFEPGVVPTPKAIWWTDRMRVCDFCGCKFKPEIGDKVTATRSLAAGKASWQACHTCIEYYEGA